MTSAKSSERGARFALPELDTTQKQVIAALTKTREYWQTTTLPYNPLRASETVESRYAAGKALRKEFRGKAMRNGNLRRSVLAAQIL